MTMSAWLKMTKRRPRHEDEKEKDRKIENRNDAKKVRASKQAR